MPDYVIGVRTEYFLSNSDGDPTNDGGTTSFEQQQVIQWLQKVGDPNYPGSYDLYETVGADPIISDAYGQRFPTANDNVDPFLALVSAGKTNIQGFDVAIWYRTFFVLTRNPETTNAVQIVGGEQSFWLPGQPAVTDNSWGTKTSDWIGVGISGDALKAGSPVGRNYLGQHLSGVGNIVILADPGFGDPNEPLDDLYNLEIDGGDVPVAAYQLIAVAKHAPFGDCWAQSRFYTLPANAPNPDRVGNYGMTWVGWLERVWSNDGSNPLVTNQWGRASTDVSHSFDGVWWKPGTKWGPSRMSLHFAPATEMQWGGWSVLPGHNAATQAGDAAVVYQNNLWLFGIGKVQHQQWFKTFDGTHWSGWQMLPGGGTTRMADAAAVFQNKLYLFAVALADNSQTVNVFDGANWTGWNQVPGGGALSSVDAALAYGGQLWLFGWVSQGGQNGSSLKMNRFDGANWGGWIDVPGSVKTAYKGFAAAVYGTKLYLFAHDADGLPIVTSFDGNSWAAWDKVGAGWVQFTEVIDGVQYDVAVEIFDAVTDGNNLYLFSIGWITPVNSHDPVALRVCLNVFDGKQWSGWNPLPGKDFPLGTSTNAAAVYDGKLYLFGIINGIDHLNIL
jgi:hypothetical protein